MTTEIHDPSALLVRPVPAAPKRSERRPAARRALPAPRVAETNALKCSQCGAAAHVHVLVGYDEGRPVRHSLCEACAGQGAALAEPQPKLHAGARLTSLICAGGLAVAALVLLADVLLPVRHTGFGKYQLLATVVGGLLLMTTLLLRIDYLALLAGLVVGGALTVDLFGDGGAPGIGWKQQTGLALAGLCVFSAVVVRVGLHIHRRRARLSGPDGRGAAAP